MGIIFVKKTIKKDVILISGKGRYKDLTGKKYTRLTVIKRVLTPPYVRKNNTDAYWLCKCDCGSNKDVFVRTADLNRGITKSCGCLQEESRHFHTKKYNTYDLSGEYGIGYTEEGDYFWFDLEDYDKIKDYYWSIDKDGYIYCISAKIRMHRFIMNCPDNLQVDHIVHNNFDNRKKYLRIVTNQQNQRNKRVHKNSQTKIKGVRFIKSKYVAYIVINYKYIHLGTYTNIEDAIKARIEAENKYFGEYSYNNSIKLSEQH